jgi:hypothetical protein
MRNDSGRPVVYTCSTTTQIATISTVIPSITPEAAIRFGWIAFFQQKGLLDNKNEILWEAQP